MRWKISEGDSIEKETGLEQEVVRKGYRLKKKGVGSIMKNQK